MIFSPDNGKGDAGSCSPPTVMQTLTVAVALPMPMCKGHWVARRQDAIEPVRGLDVVENEVRHAVFEPAYTEELPIPFASSNLHERP